MGNIMASCRIIGAGLNDIKERLVRVLHPLSFVDDPTRMLRAVRFEGRFNFQIEKRTLELLLEARPLVGQVSGDRIRHELDHILDLDQRVIILERLSELGLLAEIHPNLVWDADEPAKPGDVGLRQYQAVARYQAGAWESQQPEETEL